MIEPDKFEFVWKDSLAHGVIVGIEKGDICVTSSLWDLFVRLVE